VGASGAAGWASHTNRRYDQNLNSVATAMPKFSAMKLAARLLPSPST
jgi:hypothetical protein